LLNLFTKKLICIPSLSWEALPRSMRAAEPWREASLSSWLLWWPFLQIYLRHQACLKLFAYTQLNSPLSPLYFNLSRCYDLVHTNFRCPSCSARLEQFCCPFRRPSHTKQIHPKLALGASCNLVASFSVRCCYSFFESYISLHIVEFIWFFFAGCANPVLFLRLHLVAHYLFHQIKSCICPLNFSTFPSPSKITFFFYLPHPEQILRRQRLQTCSLCSTLNFSPQISQFVFLPLSTSFMDSFAEF